VQVPLALVTNPFAEEQLVQKEVLEHVTQLGSAQVPL